MEDNGQPTCMKCGIPTFHKSGHCGKCRAIKCKDCGERFTPASSGRNRCTKCQVKWRDKSRKVSEI